MDIVPDNTRKKSTAKPVMEQVEREKQEYKLLGTVKRTKGLMLFSYDPRNDTLIEIKEDCDKTAVVCVDEDELIIKKASTRKATINLQCIQFESLNWNNAKKKVQRFKEGKIKQLFNLKPYNPDGINLFR